MTEPAAGTGTAPARTPAPAPATADSEPILFGLLEGLCFACLFLSPLLAGSDPGRVWVAVALLRIIVLGTTILPCRGAEPLRKGREARLFLGHALLYQAPFWLSALFFPLSAGQQRYALAALGLQLLLTSLILALTQWTRIAGAESMVFLLTLGWMLGYRPPGLWLAGAGLGLLCTLRHFWCRPSWGWSCTPWQALAVGVTWWAAVAMPVLTSTRSQSGSVPLFWVMLLYLASILNALQIEAIGNREVEFAAPDPRLARVWLGARRSFMTSMGWGALLILAIDRPQGVIACVVLLTGWWRGLELAARAWFSPDRTVWWVAGEITLVWLSFETSLIGGAGVLALALAYALVVRSRWRPADHFEAAPGSDSSASLAQLEDALRRKLRHAAPPDLAKRVLQESTPVELDATLTAAAPAGFRERLMQRLRQTEEP